MYGSLNFPLYYLNHATNKDRFAVSIHFIAIRTFVCELSMTRKLLVVVNSIQPAVFSFLSLGDGVVPPPPCKLKPIETKAMRVGRYIVRYVPSY